MFLKQRHYESGSKSTKILAWKLKKKIAENTVHKIRDPSSKKKKKINQVKFIKLLKYSTKLCMLQSQVAVQLE